MTARVPSPDDDTTGARATVAARPQWGGCSFYKVGIRCIREAGHRGVHDYSEHICLATHPTTGNLCMEPPGHDGNHRAMGVRRVQWFGPGLECSS